MASCCPTDKLEVASDYTPIGTKLENGDYITGPSNATEGIVFCYDIFGASPQAFQVADIIANNGGYRVYMSDPLGKNTWASGRTDFNNVPAWLKEVADWDTVVRPSLQRATEYFKDAGIKKYSGLGFCWGGVVCVQAVNNGFFSTFTACHPAFLEDGKLLNNFLTTPCCIIISKDEGSFEAWEEGAKNSTDPLTKELSRFHYFPTMHHGFMGARGDFSDPENKKKVDEAIELVIAFYKDVFKRM